MKNQKTFLITLIFILSFTLITKVAFATLTLGATSVTGSDALTVIGGSSASQDLTLSSTSDATKGKILFGTSAYDEVNNRLGIGTVTPSYNLDVSGSAYIHNSLGSLYLDSSTGFIGIGTTSPSGRLSIETAGGDNMVTLNSGLALENGFLFQDNGVNRWEVYQQTPSGFGADFFHFYNYSSNILVLTLKSNGNVGFQTMVPTANLQVAQGTTGVGTVSVGAGGTAWTGVGTQFLNTFKVGDSIISEGQTKTIATITTNTALTTNAVGAAISAKAYTLVGGTRFSVLGNGNVGIGTTAPNAKLDINSNSFILETAQTPATSSATCTVGTIAWDTGYVYVCTATNTWKRSALSTW